MWESICTKTAISDVSWLGLFTLGIERILFWARRRVKYNKMKQLSVRGKCCVIQWVGSRHKCSSLAVDTEKEAGGNPSTAPMGSIPAAGRYIALLAQAQDHFLRDSLTTSALLIYSTHLSIVGWQASLTGPILAVGSANVSTKMAKLTDIGVAWSLCLCHVPTGSSRNGQIRGKAVCMHDSNKNKLQPNNFFKAKDSVSLSGCNNAVWRCVSSVCHSSE